MLARASAMTSVKGFTASAALAASESVMVVALEPDWPL